MANLHSLFDKFNSTITISSSKSESLRTSRDALRDDIKEWFSDQGKTQPSFHGQGSYAMKTLINPINDNEYDIDDGIYIEGYEDVPFDEWPVPATVHSWIKDAVDDRTYAGATDKDTCVRVSYSKGYHIDLPAYIVQDGAYLAHKRKGWFISDPKAFTDWFISKVKNEYAYGEQLRRVVKYIKAWRDYTGNPLKGIEITILTVNAFQRYEGRDDKCLKDTVEQIISNIEVDFHCFKPVEPYEDLFDDASETRKNNIISGLKSLLKKMEKAIDEENEKEASLMLINDVFGNRFPLGKETTKDHYAASVAPGVLKSDGRSA